MQRVVTIITEIAAIAALIALALLVWLEVYEPARSRRAEHAVRETALRNEVADLSRRRAELSLRRDGLSTEGRDAVEEAIRSELGWGRPGEVRAPVASVTEED